MATQAQVWEKGFPIAGYDSGTWRRDSLGNVIKYSAYGTQGEYGWEIDHIIPQAKGGSDALSNLQPLQWQANREKADNYK
jgi:5-methylcytosine-specific restriction endonuclease McrA